MRPSMAQIVAEVRNAERAVAGRFLPKGWRDFLIQLALFAVVDIAYELTRGYSLGTVQAAFRHAQDVVSL